MCTFSSFLDVISSNFVQQLSLWHKNLAHPSDVVLEKLAKASFLGYVYSLFNKTMCIICPLAKSQKLPFIFKHIITSSPFDLFFLD